MNSSITAIYIETTAAIIIAFMVIIGALSMLRDRHYGDRKWAARIGAMIYGALFGSFTGFVLVPIYLMVMNGEASYNDPDILMRRLPAFLVLMIFFRTDVTGRIPYIGTFIRAYRQASLRRFIETANKRLDKMTALESAKGVDNGSA